MKIRRLFSYVILLAVLISALTVVVLTWLTLEVNVFWHKRVRS